MTTLNKRPILPPRGVFSPSVIVYDKSLAPTVRDTYTMLRGLAWGKSETPPLSFDQLEEITGKARATIYGHMRELDTRGALRWRSAGDARLIVSFFDLDDLGDEQQISESESESRNLESRNLDLPDDDVLKESLNHHQESLESRNLEKIQKSGQPIQKSGQPIQKSGQEIQKPGLEPAALVMNEGFGKLVKLWESIRGPIAPFEAEEIKAMLSDWDNFAASMPEGHHTKAVSAEDALSEAMRTTARQARSANMKYARKVFTSFMADGVPGFTAAVSAPDPITQPPVEPEVPGQYAPMPDSAKRALEALLRKREAANVSG